MADRRSDDENRMQGWAGRALLDSAELARRRAELMGGSPEQHAAANRLSFERTVLVMTGEVGYEAVTVEDLVVRSGSNRARFYDAFADKAECFTEAYATAAEALAERLLARCERADDWASGMRGALEELARFVGAEPAVARGLVAEPGGAGAAVAAKREEVFGRLSRAIDRARRETIESRHPLPPFTPSFILSAIGAAVLKFLADPDAGDFEAELPGLVYLVVVYYLGPEAARAQVQALRSAN